MRRVRVCVSRCVCSWVCRCACVCVRARTGRPPPLPFLLRPGKQLADTFLSGLLQRGKAGVRDRQLAEFCRPGSPKKRLSLSRSLICTMAARGGSGRPHVRIKHLGCCCFFLLQNLKCTSLRAGEKNLMLHDQIQPGGSCSIYQAGLSLAIRFVLNLSLSLSLSPPPPRAHPPSSAHVHLACGILRACAPRSRFAARGVRGLKLRIRRG